MNTQKIKIGSFINVKGHGKRKVIRIGTSVIGEIVYYVYFHKSSTKILSPVYIDNIIF